MQSRPAARPAADAKISIQVLDLASVRRLYLALERRRQSLSEGELVGAWSDLSLVLGAVTGSSADATTFEELRRAATSPSPVRVLATRGVSRRDAVADRLLALGYSARETADVLTGRISQRSLDRARGMIAAGIDRQIAADYLDGEYRRARAAMTPRPTPTPSLQRFSTAFDSFIDRYAALYDVESALVKAIIAAESAFNPAARSRAGAIGLMQLMPGTARELGVNPAVPEQNIEGGVRYFAQLLKSFETVELALVAYNAGPGFAERYARGQTGLYGETRDYVARVLGTLGRPAGGSPVQRNAKTR